MRSQVGIAHEEEGRVVVFEDGSAEFFGGKHLHPAVGARDETTAEESGAERKSSEKFARGRRRLKSNPHSQCMRRPGRHEGANLKLSAAALVMSSRKARKMTT